MTTYEFTLEIPNGKLSIQASEDHNDCGTIGYLGVEYTEDKSKTICVGLDESDLRMLAANLLAFADYAKSQKLKA